MRLWWLSLAIIRLPRVGHSARGVHVGPSTVLCFSSAAAPSLRLPVRVICPWASPRHGGVVASWRAVAARGAEVGHVLRRSSRRCGVATWSPRMSAVGDRRRGHAGGRRTLYADLARMERYEADGFVTGVAAWSRVPAELAAELAVGTRFDLDGLSIARAVRETGGPTRVDSFGQDTGAIAREARAVGIRASVGCRHGGREAMGGDRGVDQARSALPQGTRPRSRGSPNCATAIAMPRPSEVTASRAV